ncbi:MAG: hypothetical protein SO082_02630 [Candidatus Limisoma sp.]|nr:hypothetical protein [Candidatus Limisoma sp.]
MKKIFSIIMACAMVIAVGSCRKNTVISSTSSVASFETVGLGSERDGSMTVRAWGKGKDKADALEQARKNALYDVIFKGVKKGEGTFNARPIIYEVNAETKYEYYFNQFFADGGEYTTYATFEDENRRARIVAKGKAQENWSTVIRVKRSELKQRLIDDGIIKP